jgi:hypothetical protein
MAEPWSRSDVPCGFNRRATLMYRAVVEAPLCLHQTLNHGRRNVLGIHCTKAEPQPVKRPCRDGRQLTLLAVRVNPTATAALLARCRSTSTSLGNRVPT